MDYTEYQIGQHVGSGRRFLILRALLALMELSGAGDRKVTIPRGEVYVSKGGEARNGDLVDWEIKINEGQTLVENARIIDTPERRSGYWCVTRSSSTREM